MTGVYFASLSILALMAYISRSRSAFVRCIVVQWANWIAGIAFVTLTAASAPWAFNILIDGIAAAVILTRPAARYQSVLGSLYLVQIACHCGYGLNVIQGTADPMAYYTLISGIGWLQILVLGAWGGGDLVRRMLHRFRGRAAAMADTESMGRLDAA